MFSAGTRVLNAFLPAWYKDRHLTLDALVEAIRMPARIAESPTLCRPRNMTVEDRVSAPADFTFSFLSTFLRRDSSSARGFEQCLQIPISAIAAGLLVEKAVKFNVHCVPSHGAPRTLAIGWSPTGTTVIPSFEGTLTTMPLTPDSCRLIIDGHYTSPGGLAGRAFDALLGNRIATATMAALLKTLGDASAADYATRSAM